MITIPELKQIVTTGKNPRLKNESEKIQIEVCGNNIIKINKKPVSWKNLQAMIFNGRFTLELDDIKIKNKIGHGGKRLPGPGKKMGRPPLKNKRKPVSFTLYPEMEQKLVKLAFMNKKSRSEVVNYLINAADVL